MEPEIQEKEPTAEELAQMRADITKEIWPDKAGDASTAKDQQTVIDEKAPDEKKLPEKKEPDDPWAGVSPALRSQFESLRTKVADYDTIANRLKQAESRIGSITNQLHQAKKTADDAQKKLDSAPTPEQMQAAAESKKKWDSLKEDYPEWASVIDDRLNEERKIAQDAIKRSEQLEQKISSLENNVSKPDELAAAKNEIGRLREEIKIFIKHPDWETLKDDGDFQKFVASRPDLLEKCKSVKSDDAIAVLDEFKAAKNQKTPEQIAQERDDRLKRSAAPKTTQQTNKKPASEDEMTNEEYRAKAIREKWGSQRR